MTQWVRLGLVGMFAGLLAVGCGSDGDGGGPESFVGTPPVTQMVTAATGGSVETGAVALNVPAGALAADTEISIEIQDKKGKPDAESIAIDVYEFGPDGTKFLKPVTLSFDLSGVDLKGKKADVAFLENGKWVKLSGSKIEGNSIKADTTHFTPFTVILTLDENGDVVQTGGMCDGGFSACGGDVTGKWSFTASCATLPPGGLGGTGSENPFAMCAEQPSASVTVDLTGSVEFKADKTYSVDQTVEFSLAFSIPKSCIQQLAMGRPFTCADLNDKDDPEEPQFTDTGDACTQSQGPETEKESGSGTWSTNGNQLVLTDGDDPSSEPDSAEYCVKGNEITVQITNDDGSIVVYKATRN